MSLYINVQSFYQFFKNISLITVYFANIPVIIKNNDNYVNIIKMLCASCGQFKMVLIC